MPTSFRRASLSSKRPVRPRHIPSRRLILTPRSPAGVIASNRRRSSGQAKLHLGEALAKTADRNAELDAIWEAALGLTIISFELAAITPFPFCAKAIVPASSWLGNGRDCPNPKRPNF
jgi:hypothetical protein